MLIPERHPLASVNDSFNAVFVHGDAVDDAMFYGRGAGELPTASAVVGDIFDIARNLQYECCGRISCTCYKQLPIKAMDDICSKYFLRMLVENEPGVLAAVTAVFGEIGELAEIVVITEKVKERHVKDSLKAFEEMTAVKKVSSVIRVYGE